MPRAPTSRANSVPEPISRKRAKIQRTCSVLLVDHQLPVLDAVAIGQDAAHPNPPLAAGGDLVADALSCHLALELGDPTYKSTPVDAASGGDPSRKLKGNTQGYKE